MTDFAERALMFVVGAVFVLGGIKFIMQALDSQRAGLPAIGMGIIGFILGLCLCVWSFTGPPG